MSVSYDSRDELAQWMDRNILSTSEVVEVLGCTRQNIQVLVARGSLRPIKSVGKVVLFLRDDVEAWASR